MEVVLLDRELSDDDTEVCRKVLPLKALGLACP